MTRVLPRELPTFCAKLVHASLIVSYFIQVEVIKYIIFADRTDCCFLKSGFFLLEGSLVA
jgi:hypothetical protein